MSQGQYEANLGGAIYKKRIPIAGKGKRGGARVILAFKANELIVFIYGFSKNEKSNVDNKEKEALKSLAKVYLAYPQKELEQAIKFGKLIEIFR